MKMTTLAATAALLLPTLAQSQGLIVTEPAAPPAQVIDPTTPALTTGQGLSTGAILGIGAGMVGFFALLSSDDDEGAATPDTN
ncbi:hypothetical protein LGQ03_00415 [Loktanella sp. TSTF-M6]|uniref:Uncharacterized protein n=1 Tax=Loktanella gaetbuli TaxID=2881335 RepID=A0ABS8BPN7_9RHOB|nr:hypothetical protein [Loktanella gaetbuli]MCB5197693.1 hypothetical protein [Loktanella gaetbuli]